jgi:hypothetical protein
LWFSTSTVAVVLAVVVATGVAGGRGASPTAAQTESPEMWSRFPVVLPSAVNQNSKANETKKLKLF